MTPLHIAAKMNNLNICRLLIEDQDVNINLQIILIVFFLILLIFNYFDCILNYIFFIKFLCVIRNFKIFYFL